jgi:glyoxalase family protein
VFEDPHAQHLALVETNDEREFAPWERSPVASDRQIVGLHTVRLWERDLKATGDFLREVLGFEHDGEEGGWHRFSVGGGGSGKFSGPASCRRRRGSWTSGRCIMSRGDADEEVGCACGRVAKAVAGRPVIDRFWFKSVYFLEPGGVLFGWRRTVRASPRTRRPSTSANDSLPPC